MPKKTDPVKPARLFLTPEQVDACFEGAQHQSDYVLALYRLVFPDFDQIERVHGFPQVGVSLSKYIWHKALAFDREHHPGVMNGSLWLSSGFSINPAFPPWDVEPCPVTYKEQAHE